MSKKLASAFFALVFVAGLGVLLYPGVSDLWNQYRQEMLISSYTQSVAQTGESSLAAALRAAQGYNAALQPRYSDAFSGEELAESDEYWQLLNINGDGVMGYLSIPKIQVHMPIFHGCKDEVLYKGTGHLYNTSLPVGGAGTHCILAAHRGVPEWVMFTYLDQLEIGDRFYLYVLDQTMTYEVDDIRMVLPTEPGTLETDPAQDYVTLLTCAPYGINTHRLLVRGHRVPNEEAASGTATEAEEADHLDWWQRSCRAFSWNGVIAIALVAAVIVGALLTRKH